MLKPSEKMLAQLAENDEPIDYSIDSIPLDFSNQSQYSDPDLEQLFTEDRARNLYIYKINNLVKTKEKPTLNYSQNSVKIGFIDKDEYIKITGYEISDFNFKLQIQQNTTVQDNSTSYVMIDEKDILINDISKQDKEFLETLDLKIVSINEPISEDNKNECYIIEEYKRPYTPDGIDIIKSTHLVKITDFKWKNQNSIHLVLQKSLPEDTVFTGIEIKYPKSMLFGNIKCWGNINGIYSYPASNIENASLAPLLSMPIETNPNLRIFQYWFTEIILPWNIAKNYIKEDDILDLVNIGNHPDKPRKQVIKYSRILEAPIVAYYNPPGKYSYDVKIPSKMPETPSISLLPPIYPGNRPMYTDLLVENGTVKIYGKLYKVLLNYLTYRYNYDRKFPGAKYDEKSNPINKSAVLRQKFEGQKPEDVIDGLFEEWKFNNPTYIKEEGIRKFKQIIYMLSNYVYSKYAINKGYNDDIKIISPYYLKLISTPRLIEGSKEEGYWEFEDCIVKLKSFYFNFSNNNIKLINNNLSENKIYQLEANYFNWLSLTNELETNNIPSLIPAEIKLSDGEYGKYLTNLIVSNENIEKILNLFSSINDSFYSKSEWINLINNIVENNFKILFKQNINALNKIEISGIWGYGYYDITVFTEKEQININNLQLFNKNNEKLSLIILEI
ncbi:hypothetical protein [Spiroplasma sp. hyd1]|uniref:hypothetical protein n=1 Tax=Spiroplasma sp. hyd1 TaxID=1609976 RepID=UPI0018DE2046|nr:hypothetical protein [Spiroplasma sp. hyd1]MBH8623531.1 hypothetical protein [Spiroplasma sp. hyd1]